jgi:hypothetical protein
MIALHGTAYHVETTVRGFRWAMQAEDLSREARQQANRSFGYSYDSDGSLVLRGRLPALAGAALVKAIEAAMDAMPATEANVELGEEGVLPYEVRRADALGMVCETFLHNQESSNTADRYQVVGPCGCGDLEGRERGTLPCRERSVDWRLRPYAV